MRSWKFGPRSWRLKSVKMFLHVERFQVRLLERRKGGAVIDRMEQRLRGGEQVVEESALGVVRGLDVGHAPVTPEREGRRCGSSPHPIAVEERAAVLDVPRDLVGGRLEVVEQIEFEIVDEAARDFVGDAVLVRVLVGARGGRALQAVQRAVEHHARRRHHASPALAAARSGSTACSPISSLSAPTMNSRIEILPPCAKKGRTRRSGSTPTTRDVSTVPSGSAVRLP